MADTIIGHTISIDGEVEGEENLVVQGHVQGRIVLKEHLAVDDTGRIQADIQTKSVTVNGQVTGNITASEKVEIKANGKMIGDIKAPRIIIEDGANFKGNVDME